MGVSERRKREREARRGAILDAARDVLLAQGLRGTTTKEIAGRCELSEATLFFYFQSKDEILLSLIFESIGFWAEGLEALAAKPLPRAALLDAIWELHEDVYREHPEYYVISAYLAQPQVLENVSAEVKEEIARRSGENFRRLRQLLGQVNGGSTGGTTGDISGGVLADLIWSLFLGLTISEASRANLGYGRANERQQVRARVFDVVRRGCGFGAEAEEAALESSSSPAAATRRTAPRRSTRSEK